MRTYFRNAELMITGREVVLLLDPQVSFAIEELHDVGLSTGAPTSLWQTFSRRWELRAIYRGNNVCLYSTTDQQTFGQVRRAMIRALEANGKL